MSGTDNNSIVRTMEEAMHRKRGPTAQMQEFATKSEAEAWLQQEKVKRQKKNLFYAIRGTARDGIVTSMKQVLARLAGENTQYHEEFSTEREVREWIEAIQFFAVRLRSGETWIVPSAVE